MAKTQLRAQPRAPVVYDVAALERARRDAQIAKARDARARARERRLDRLFSTSADPRVAFSKLHERPRADDRVAYPLSTPFAAHLDHVRDQQLRTQDRARRVLDAHRPSLLAARRRLRQVDPDLSMAFELTHFGGLSQSAVARQMGTTPSCVHKRVERALRLLDEWMAPGPDQLRTERGAQEQNVAS
jgi:DNA-directed RNA polymerase specialized sigma24 family protein